MQAARCIEPIHRDDRRRPGRPQVSTLVGVRSQRSVVDYGLARRATLSALRGSGSTTREDVCDAHPYLLRAARHHGVPTDRDCPVCGRRHLTTVSYVYGEELGSLEGRVKTPRELEEMAREHGEFRVYVVEVCAGCGWNHLVQSYVLGDGVDRRVRRGRRRGRRRDAAEHAGAGAGSGGVSEG
jgi:hypothetical protein